MAAPRVEIPEVVLSGGQAVSGASVQVNNRGAGSATVFAAEVGGTTAANPIITDVNGRIEGWLEEGSYDLVVSATGLTTYTQPYEAVRGNNSPGKIATATGDIVYASSANNIARLAIGSTGQALVVSGGVPTWGTVSATTYRKATPKTVNTTVSPTDLLNAEITIGAGVMGATGLVRVAAWGDWKQNSGVAAPLPRFQLVLGATTIFDTGTSSGTCTNAVTRLGWGFDARIQNAGSVSSQTAEMGLRVSAAVTANGDTAFITGEGIYEMITPSARGVAVAEGYNTSAENTSLAKALVLNVINGSASATYEVVLAGALIEIV